MPEKTVFGTFFVFFLGKNFFFSPTFVEIFSGSLKFSRGLFRIFSRGDFFFLGQKIKNFLGQIFFFSGTIFSAGVKNFLGQIFFFSQAESFQQASTFQRVKSRFTGVFLKIPTGSDLLL